MSETLPRSFFPAVRAASMAGARRLARLTGRGAEVLDRAVERTAARLVRAVRRGGDAALLDAVRRFDDPGLPADAPAAALRLAVPSAGESARELAPALVAALDAAIARVEAFHRPQVVPGYRLEEGGVELVELRRPLRRVGLYVPGGRAIYPSTVIMTAVPARVAGVPELVVTTPPAAFRASAALRYVLAKLEVGEVWGMGGAQAIAALAYGTESLRRVDKICGPGNAWVTAAKKQVAGDVGIDGIAGPSEVVVVADAEADAAWVAADLLAQAEHDPRAAAVLVTRSAALAGCVRAELARQLPLLATAETARASLARFGTAFVVASDEAAVAMVNALAPEHLQLIGPGAEALAGRIEAAGAIFLGAASGEVFGDYLAGPSHVLPTCGNARFASALGVEDFVRRSHTIRLAPDAAARLAPAAATLAAAEGLPAHRAAALARSGSGEPR